MPLGGRRLKDSRRSKSYEGRRRDFGKLDYRQFGSPIETISRPVEKQKGLKVDPYLIGVAARIWINLVMVDLRSMNDLVAGFSKREVFRLLSFRPV